MWIAYVAAFATAVCYGVSAVLEDAAAKRTAVTGKSGKRAAFRVTVSGRYVLGMAFSVVAWLLTLLALRRLPLFAVQAIAASSIGVAVVLTHVLTGRRSSAREVLLLVVLGVAMVSLAAFAAPGDPRRATAVFKLCVWIGVVVVAAAAVAATRLSGARGAALLGAVSGLSDGGMALCARALHHHSIMGFVGDPLAWALVPFTIIGIVAFAASLQRGAVSVALACQQAVLAVVPSVIGLLVLGDRARHGFIVPTYAGFVVTVLAVVGLTFVEASASASHAVTR